MFRLLSVLKNRSFLFLWLAELFSQIAMNMMNFVLILFAFHIGASNTAVSGIVLAFTIPALLFGIIAGVYVDYWDKKKVLIATNILRGAILFLFVFFERSMVFLYAATFVISIITQFFIPAETPMIPLVVDESELFSANALFSMAWFGSVFIAYGLSGPILLFLGRSTTLLFLVGVFFLAGAIAYFIRLRRPISTIPKKKLEVFVEIKGAITMILKNTDVAHAFFLLALAQVLTLVISVLGPGFARDILHIQVDAFPLVFITPAIVGMVIGSVIAVNFFRYLNRHKSSTLGLFLAAPAVLAMAYGREISRFLFSLHIFPLLPHELLIWVMVIIAVCLGIANAFMFVPSNILVQEQTTDASRGKIYGTLASVVALLSFLPVLIVGPLADFFGVAHVLMGISVAVILLAFVRMKL